MSHELDHIDSVLKKKKSGDTVLWSYSGSPTWLCTRAFHTTAQWSSEVPGSLVTVDLGSLDNN